MINYIKLSNDELDALYNTLDGIRNSKNSKYTELIALVKKYFPNPVSILVSISSEYNDETYDNKISSIAVYGADEIELGLTPAKRQEFNNKSQRLYLGESNSEEPQEDIVIHLASPLPELYKKVS